MQFLLRQAALVHDHRPWTACTTRGRSGDPSDDVMETKDDLTYTERLILRLLARDLTLREIGSELNRSAKTVRTHVHSIYRKLGVSSAPRP